MFAAVPPANHSPAESVFVYGRDRTAVSTLIVGLALRRHGSFSWADCAISARGTSLGLRELFARGRSRSLGDGVDRSEMVARSWSSAALERLLVPENRMDSLHLLSYLALPALLQELAAMSTSPSGESSVLLANVDALDRRLRASVLGTSDVHDRLHRAEVTLFATCHSRPTRVETALFDRIFRVDVPPGAIWSDGTVLVEKGHDDGEGTLSLSLKRAWTALGLDPTLLPPP